MLGCVGRQVLQRNHVRMCGVAATVRRTDSSIPLFPGCSERAFPSLHVATNTALNGEQHRAHHGDHAPDVHQHQQVTTAGLSSQHSAGDSQGHPCQDTRDEDHLSAEGASTVSVPSSGDCPKSRGTQNDVLASAGSNLSGRSRRRGKWYVELVNFDCSHETTVYRYFK